MSVGKATALTPLMQTPVRTTDAVSGELSGIKNEALQRKREEAEKVAQEFETMFIDMMVKSMRQTAQREDASNAEDIYQGMLDSEYSKSMTASQSFGIRTQILDWLEQTDPDLKSFSNEKNASQNNSSVPQAGSLDSKQLLNESIALKAAAQAYKISSMPR